MKNYTCPQCGETFDTLCGPIDEIDLDLEHEASDKKYYECPECGYRDQLDAFED